MAEWSNNTQEVGGRFSKELDGFDELHELVTSAIELLPMPPGLSEDVEQSIRVAMLYELMDDARRTTGGLTSVIYDPKYNALCGWRARIARADRRIRIAGFSIVRDITRRSRDQRRPDG